MTNRALIKRIEREMASLSARRESIRKVLEAAGEIEEVCAKAIDSLQEAVFALSEVV
jgi:predicted  nucleic acid-binding Zn-ribbon protein